MIYLQIQVHQSFLMVLGNLLVQQILLDPFHQSNHELQVDYG